MEKIFDVTALGELLIDFIEHGLENLGSDNLSEMLKFASAAASIITTKRGALKVMPEREDVLQLLRAKEF